MFTNNTNQQDKIQMYHSNRLANDDLPQEINE